MLVLKHATEALMKNPYSRFGISDGVYDRGQAVECALENQFKNVEARAESNQLKVLDALQSHRLSDLHFGWNTGYGYDDIGRETVEKIYATVFGAEDAIVRPTIVNGTHALTLCLWGMLRPTDELLCITGHPYDTLHPVIGIPEISSGSLRDFGITYQSCSLTPQGHFDYLAIEQALTSKTRVVYIQRSAGYSWRPSLTLDAIQKVIEFVKSRFPNVLVMVDNCYGEFLEDLEPTQVGADVMAGSLIKNPGGGLALTGGYIVGKHHLIEAIAARMTSPKIGKECGLTFGLNRQVLMGLFLAPHVVAGAIKSAIFCSALYESLGFEVCPSPTDPRSDIIQSIKLGTPEKIIAFCRGIQAAAPVDSHVTPVPWAMPGYDSDVIMAAGAFVQGSSIELSADAPIREPYIVYYQGGLTYTHGKLGVLKSLNSMIEDNVFSLT